MQRLGISLSTVSPRTTFSPCPDISEDCIFSMRVNYLNTNYAEEVKVMRVKRSFQSLFWNQRNVQA